MLQPVRLLSKHALLGLLIATLTFGPAAQAAPARKAKPSTRSSAETVVVTPDYLRQQLLDNNSSVLIGLNNLYQAKRQVDQARANLLPSISITGSVPVAAGAALKAAPSFILSAVNFLLPFLMPSNWFNLKAGQYHMVAEGIGFYLVELNAFASAYGLYTTLVNDLELRKIVEDQHQTAMEIAKIVIAQQEMGTASVADVMQAKAQVSMSELQVANLDKLIQQEMAVLRKTLGLSLTTKIELEPIRPGQVAFEDAAPYDLYSLMVDKTPEAEQMTALISAGKKSKWSQAFAWLGGGSLSLVADPGESSVSFNNLMGSQSINLGFGIFPAVGLSNLNVDQMKLRRTEVQRELARTIEVTLGSMGQAKREYDLSASAEGNFRVAYEAQLQAYRMGTTDLLHVLTASGNITTAAVSRLQAQIDLDGQRINLQRILISDQFAKIPKCKMNGHEHSGGKVGWFKDIFSTKSSTMTIDRICRGK